MSLFKTLTYCKIVPLGLLALISANSGRAQENKPPLDKTVCQLIAKPRHFHKIIVHIRASVETDLIEHTILVDTSCKNRGIVLWIPHSLDDDPSVRSLWAALKHHVEARNGQPVVADCVGKFLYQNRKYYLKVSSLRVLVE